MLKSTKLLLQKMDELAKLIESNELDKLRKESAELKKTKDLISHVKFKIKDVRVVDNTETCRKNVIVTYELPRIVLELDENGNVNKNDFFYSSNMLNMISLEDMTKFQNTLRNIKKY